MNFIERLLELLVLPLLLTYGGYNISEAMRLWRKNNEEFIFGFRIMMILLIITCMILWCVERR